MKQDWQKTTQILKHDGIVVIPTDTLYGLCASAFSKNAIEKIYKIKERDRSKALIVLIHSLKDLEKFGINVDKDLAKILKKFWPREVSILLSCKDSQVFFVPVQRQYLLLQLQEDLSILLPLL